MANKVYVANESVISWLASGGTNVLTLTSLAAGAGRQGAQHDFGASSKSRIFTWRLFVRFATTPVVGEAVEVFWKTSDGTYPDNDDGTGDIALSSEDKLRNLRRLGVVYVDEAATGVTMVNGEEFEFSERYGQPVIFNATADALSSTASECGFLLTPVPSEIQ